MKWRPFRYEPDPAEVEAMEQSEFKLEVAQQMEEHAHESARVHTGIRIRNNLSPKFQRALGGHSS